MKINKEYGDNAQNEFTIVVVKGGNKGGEGRAKRRYHGKRE